MGQRPSSVQQSEVARRPRTNSELGANGGTTTARRHHHRAAIVTRFRQQDSSSSSSASMSSASSAEEGAGTLTQPEDVELARQLLQLGLTNSGSGTSSLRVQNGAITPSSAASTSNTQLASASHRAARRSESSAHQQPAGAGQHRFGSQRLSGHHRTREGTTSSSSSNDLLTSGRLQQLLQSLDAMAASSASSSTPPSAAQVQRLRHSAPLLQLLGRDIKCPVCRKQVPSDDVEIHLVMCLTRPQLSYNDDVLTADKGECAICLEEMAEGNHIARLPCLCIYHKGCIDEWFKRKNTCPEHPGED